MSKPETLAVEDKVVTISYSLKDENGDLLDSSEENGDLAYLHGYEGIMPGLEKALDGHPVGHSVKLNLSGEDAYGDYDDSLIFSIPKEEFPSDFNLEVGQEFEAEIRDSVRYCTIEQVGDDGQVRINANHPLAGKTLQVEAKILQIRDATDEEIDHGHVHHPGHDHH